jgi:hypothetical protein
MMDLEAFDLSNIISNRSQSEGEERTGKRGVSTVPRTRSPQRRPVLKIEEVEDGDEGTAMKGTQVARWTRRGRRDS